MVAIRRKCKEYVMKFFSEFLAEDINPITVSYNDLNQSDRLAYRALSDMSYNDIFINIPKYADSGEAIKSYILYKMIRAMNIQKGASIDSPEIVKRLEAGNYLTNALMISTLSQFGVAQHWGILSYFTEVLPEKYITPELIEACLKISICNIRSVPHPTKEHVTTALTDPEFIQEPDLYTDFVKKHFKDNTVLLNKWMRYGENMRGMS
jgi:hypothetical protein